MENKLMNKDDVKKYLGIGRDRVNELFKLKSFPCIRINKTCYIYEEDLVNWLKMHRGQQIILQNKMPWFLKEDQGIFLGSKSSVGV